MSFLEEIKRRKIFQVAAVYAVVAWLLIQIVATVEAPLSLPSWFDTAIIVALAIGFPIALILAWAFDVTPDGVVKDQGIAQGGSRRIEYVLIGLLVVAVGWILYRTEFADPETVTGSSISTGRATGEVATVTSPEVLPNSIAVLPFENLSLDPEDAFFAAGIHESTLNQLAKISGLIVLSRSSVMQYVENRPPVAEVAKALNVETVMEGSVRYANGQVLISAQLIDGKTDAHLWSGEFNRELVDVFAIQADVAKQIATAMQVQLLPDEQARIESRPTSSPEAYQHYLHAMSLPFGLAQPEYLPAIIYSLEQAIAADPDFAEAYAALSFAHTHGIGDRAIGVDYAEKAIDLNPAFGGAYLVLGQSYGFYYARQDEARQAFEQAVEISPNDPGVLIQHAYRLADNNEDHAEAIRLAKRAVAIDPTSDHYQEWLGFIYMRSGDLAAAAKHLREAIRLETGSGVPYVVYMNLAYVEYLGGNLSAAKEHLDYAVTIMSQGATFRASYIAYLYGLLGEMELAEGQLARLENIYSDRQRGSWPPEVWAILGTRNKQRAIQAWQTAITGYLEEDRPFSPGAISRFRDNWLNDPMLEEPEFLELRRRLGYDG